MAKIITRNVSVDPPNPAADTHAIYSKAGGVFVKNSAGTVVGPLGTGGGGGPTGPAGGDLSGTYPNPTIAAKAVGTSKIADPTDGQYSLLYADSATSWQSKLPPRVKFAGPSRISILGDVPVNVTDPQNPRVVNSVGPDTDLGYLARTQWAPMTGAGTPVALFDGFTYYELTLFAPTTYTLPDCRAYPPGTEIIVLNRTPGLPVPASISETGAWFPNPPDPNKAISGPFAATGAPQVIPGDCTGRRFITNGQPGSGWILIGAF